MENAKSGLSKMLESMGLDNLAVSRSILQKQRLKEWGEGVATGKLKFEDIQGEVSVMGQREKEDLYFFLSGLCCGLGMHSELLPDPDNAQFYFILGKLDLM